MNGYPCRCAASPWKGDGALCCGAALAGRPAVCAAPVVRVAGYPLEHCHE